MNGTSHSGKRIFIVAGGLTAVLFSGWACSADLNEVRVTFDPGYTDRTNMGRTPGDSSVLGVAFDQDIAQRTNMLPRDPKEAGTVTAQPDMGLRERTNMGGIARRDGQRPDATETAAVK